MLSSEELRKEEVREKVPCGDCITTRFFDAEGNLVRQDVRIEVSKAALISGMAVSGVQAGIVAGQATVSADAVTVLQGSLASSAVGTVLVGGQDITVNLMGTGMLTALGQVFVASPVPPQDYGVSAAGKMMYHVKGTGKRL